MYKCKICENVDFDKYTSLSRHMCLTHKMKTDEVYVEYYLEGIWPTCKCGCRGKTKYSYMLKKFREYCQGHQSRVHNNWGHNPKAIENSAETRRQQYKSGERKTWNYGKTKETNESIRSYGEKIAERFTPEIRNKYSNNMKKLREEGKIVPLQGPKHSRWNGGTSSVSMLVYNDVKFYKEWKYPILLRDKFKCVECGKSKNLHIHHNKEMLCEIIKKHIPDNMDVSNYTLKRTIADAVVDYHIKNNVSGITLCSECHNNLHPSLNF